MNKLKVLFLAAYPDKSPLKLDEEIRSITQKIRASEYRDTMDLVSAWAVRPDDLIQTLNEYKPHIVHFSGHGGPSGEMILVAENLVDGKRVSKPVSPVAIKALFQTLKDNIQVVLLNACYSRIQADAIREIVDCVIGMNSAIEDRAAMIFAASFYRAIGFGRSVKEAFEQGKLALMLEGIPEENTPELLCRLGIDPAKVFLIEHPTNKEKLLDQPETKPKRTELKNNSQLFDALISDKIKGFIGRKFIFDAFDEFLYTHESGYFIIRGVPGIGKSALVAKLVKDRGYVHHFNIAPQNVCSPEIFLENICTQLIACYGFVLLQMEMEKSDIRVSIQWEEKQ